MDQPSRRNPIVVALYVNAALLAALIVAVLARSDAPTLIAPAFGQAQQPAIAGGAGLFVVPAQFSDHTWGCYLIDVDTQNLCAYQYMPGEKLLKLTAARNIAADRKLARFNTADPTPQEVQELVNKQNAAARGANASNAAAAQAPTAPPVAPPSPTAPAPSAVNPSPTR
jgi:hypothetical protein